MIVTTKDLFEQAYGKYAVGAYNINNLEQTIGLFRGNLGKKDKNEEKVANNTAAPFIIQLSRGARSYTDKRYLESMIRTSEEVFPEAVFAVHLDHGTERSEEHTSELRSRLHLVCRLLLEKKKKKSK